MSQSDLKKGLEPIYPKTKVTTSVKLTLNERDFLKAIGGGSMSQGLSNLVEWIEAEIMTHDNERLIERARYLVQYRYKEPSKLDLLCQKIAHDGDKLVRKKLDESKGNKKKLLPESELKLYTPFTYPAYKQGKATIEDMRKELASFGKNLDDYEFEGRE